MRLRTLSAFAVFSGLNHLVEAGLQDVPSVNNFLHRFSGTAIVIGDYVYVDGGEILQLDNVTGSLDPAARKSNQVNSTLSIDLTKSWTTTNVQINTIPKAPGPVKANTVLWADRARNAFYSWGGKWMFGKNMDKTELWKFSANGNGGGKWSLEVPSNPSVFNGLIPAEFPSFATVNNTGIAIGGVASGWTQLYRDRNQAIPGMLTYNFDTREWKNETDSSPDQFTPIHSLTEARAEYVPTFGPGGLVFLMGGHKPDTDREPSAQNSPALDFKNLTFFDPGARKTYYQQATGDIPPSPRSEFCSAGWQNTDGGYEIFIFGGENKAGQGDAKYRDAYILSLPGFVWFKLSEPPAGPRAYHSCVAVGKRQILSIGGMGSSGTEQDQAPQGMLLYDMTAMKWKDDYDASLGPYERSNLVKSFYKSGSLDKVEWSSDVVKNLFVRQGSSGNGNGSVNNPNLSEPGKSGISAGAIAGIAVGGVVALAAIAAVVWFLRRRKQQARSDDIANQEGVYQAQPPAPPKSPHHPTEVSSSLRYSELASPEGFYAVPEKHYGTEGHVELPPRAGYAELSPNSGVLPVKDQPPQSYAAELDAGDTGRSR